MNSEIPSVPQTPMVRQYERIKSQYRDAILFYRMGDFYEMFFEDARVASRILNIALTSRDKDKEGAIPLCGVPFHSAETYITRLVREGHKVAVCEQVGEVPRGSKLVRREVVRVVTPGTILSEGFLTEKRNNFLAAFDPRGGTFGLAFLDLSTGDFLAGSVPAGSEGEALNRLADFEPSEILVPAGSRDRVASLLRQAGLPHSSIQELDASAFDPGNASRELLGQFGTVTLEPFGITPETPEVTGAAGAVLHYALETQKHALTHVRRLALLAGASHLQIDAATQRNLELVRSAAHGGREGTLLAVLDETLTPMGGRLLRQWILRPLTRLDEIEARLEAVGLLVERGAAPAELGRLLGSVRDLERLLGRISLGQAGPRDLLALRASLVPLPRLLEILAGLPGKLMDRLRGELDPLEDLAGLLGGSLRDDSPTAAREGGFIRQGYDQALDEWLTVKQDGRRWIADLESRERQRSGIAGLKIRYNRVFGYFIEISKANLKEIPSDYLRKQTLVGAERFTCPELTGYETRILEADERCLARELELFAGLCREVTARGERISRSCRAIAELDVLLSLARVAAANSYCRPLLDGGDVIDLKDGRHPVVERVNPDEPFIPNDCLLNGEDARMLIITGPNMAGKSTYLRQVALIVLMAQMGSFVPCREARIGVVDRIFTRVGATDYLVRGQSTFMVEMTETAAILHNAGPRSLVILDEIGRGTSTFDGLSIAWAVAEYLHDNPASRPRTLFATHYHQLTELALTLAGVRNYSTAVREWGERIVFLRRIVEGGSDKSYGIQVARLAGLPAAVIERAREIMANLESGEFNTVGLPRLADHHRPPEDGGATVAPPSQLYLFGSAEEEVLTRLRSLDQDRLTPLEALNLLADLSARLKK